uniref:EF-hand domain-containing protein n=1 Tax=Pyrodinium bahamense TaxID=73915 RepID=A0A7S0B1M2_9DINO|mmetsp:Transcript_46800/g.130299  ORF Transcript_46800/g.130299 Transcript_46800/m.130299 type:complete len:652 (+) Transcript_46800:97-2052(+)
MLWPAGEPAGRRALPGATFTLALLLLRRHLLGTVAAIVHDDAVLLLQVPSDVRQPEDVSLGQELGLHVQLLGERVGEDEVWQSLDGGVSSGYTEGDWLAAEEDLDLEPLQPQIMVFRRFDADGSNAYDRAELAEFLKGFRNISSDGFNQLWQTADLDGNDAIDYDEFLDCVVNPASCYSTGEYVESAAVTELIRTTPGATTKHDVWRSEKKARKRMAAIDSTALSEDEAARMAASGERPLRLILMSDKGLDSSAGAVCLDGSDAGFYFAHAAGSASAGKWIIMLQGGAWCFNAEDCLARSTTDLGSSKFWSQSANRGGIMSGNCLVNPDFCNFNRVMVAYCDGASYTGDREQPLQVRNNSGAVRPVYFRGKRILDAVLDTLLTSFGLDLAEQVLFAGCSAGGLGSLVHADYVNQRLRAVVPALTKFRVLPLSGYFLRHNSVENQAVYPAFMKRVVELSNSTSSLNKRCTAAMPPGKSWVCILADFAYKFTETPVFLVNSAMDWWSGFCVLFSALRPAKVAIGQGSCGLSHRREHYPCADNIERCKPFEMFAVNQFIRDFSSSLEANPSYSKAGNGAFVHSCHLHCEALESAHWGGITAGGTTMQEAVLKWWKSDGMPASGHTYKPCEYGQGGPDGQSWPYQCNPTCVALPE